MTLTVLYEDFSTYTRSKTVPIWTSNIFVIKRTALQLLSEFIGRQKIRLVGVGVTKLREIDERQTLITDLPYCFKLEYHFTVLGLDLPVELESIYEASNYLEQDFNPKFIALNFVP